MVTIAVEGDVDEAVAVAILDHLRLDLEISHVTRGQPALLEKLPGYNAAATREPWFVLTDLDGGESGKCAGEFVAEHLPRPARLMRFRVAVQQVEAWLLADRANLAEFLSVAPSRIPRDPDSCVNAKKVMVQLGRASRRRAIREGMVPSPDSGRTVGPDYTSMMIEFALYHWEPGVARRSSPSLDRCLDRVATLAGGT